MEHPLLTRHQRPARPQLEVLAGQMTLARGRVHELCGTARQTLATQVAACTQGPVIWIAPGWETDRLHGAGMCQHIDPGRLILCQPDRAEDLLWCMEEALRAGAVMLVVCTLPALPGLTAIRRLHLAAETGGKEGKTLPLGLILTPDSGGAPGVESRWQLDARHGPDQPDGDVRQVEGGSNWHLARLRARTAPPAHWDLTESQDADGRIRLVPSMQPQTRAPKRAPKRATPPAHMQPL